MAHRQPISDAGVAGRVTVTVFEIVTVAGACANRSDLDPQAVRNIVNAEASSVTRTRCGRMRRLFETEGRRAVGSIRQWSNAAFAVVLLGFGLAHSRAPATPDPGCPSRTSRRFG